MLFLNVTQITQLSCIVLLFNTLFFQIANNQFVLTTLTLTSNTQSFTVPYNKTLPSQPINYAYFIECGTINQHQFYLRSSVNETQLNLDHFTIKFFLDGVNSMSPSQFLTVKVLISSYSSDIFTLNMVSTTSNTEVAVNLPKNYDPIATINDLQVKIFVLNIPMTFTQSMNSTHLKIIPTQTPTNITKISFSFIIITRTYESYNIGLLIESVRLGSLGWIILFNNDDFFNPSVNTMLVGVSSYASKTFPILSIQDYVDYNFSFPLYPDQQSVYISYNINGDLPSVMDTTIFIFSEIFKECPGGGFLTYTELYYDSPLSCQPCHLTCKTCISVNYSLSYTDEHSCTSCSQLKYMQSTVENSSTGQCKCYPGLKINMKTEQCLPCQSNCLGFKVNFMRAPTQSVFLLSFSSVSNLLMPMESNMKITVNQNTTLDKFTVKEIRTNFYSITVDNDLLTACETKCQVEFKFLKPWKVIKRSQYKSLTQNIQTLTIQNYFHTNDKIPEQINQAFTISSMLVGLTSSGGMSSLLKMMFELEQMIQFHKYLNVDLPLIFKEFIETLSVFRFLDVTTLIPFDIQQFAQSLSTQEFDTLGPIQYVYYDYGSNFYKNMSPMLISFFIVVLINLILFLLLKMIPCGLFWRLSQKLRVRKLITFSDLLETMILPIIAYGNVQLLMVHYRFQIIWIYILATGLFFAVLFVPFFIIAYVYIHRHNEQTKDVYQDLMQDCDLNSSATYAFYVVAFYRKILFSFSMLDLIPGMVQVYSVLTINTIYLSFIFYVLSQKIFHSKIKMLTKIINATCVIGIEAVMIVYNQRSNGFQTMLDLGSACVYLAIIATISGIFEAFIKIYEIISQQVRQHQAQKKVLDNSLKTQLQNESKIQNKSTDMINGVSRQFQKMMPLDSIESIEILRGDGVDSKKKSLWSRPKKKLNFISNLIIQNKNNDASTNANSIQLDQNQHDSFDKMIDSIDVNDMISMDSYDDFVNGGRSGDNRRGNSANDDNQRDKLSNKVKWFNPGNENNNQSIDAKPTGVQKINKVPAEKLKQKNIDDEIMELQNRIRLKMLLKKKNNKQIQINNKKPSQTQQIKNEISQNLRSISRKSDKKVSIKESQTSRLKNGQTDDNLMENINEKKSRRRRKIRQTDHLVINQSKQKKEQI